MRGAATSSPTTRGGELDENWLTRRQAARRVKRSFNTIRRWQRQGMPTRLINGQTYIEEETLLAWWRDRQDAWPIWQQRLRVMLREQERDTPK